MLKKRDMTAGEIAEEFDISKAAFPIILTTTKTGGMVIDEKKRPVITTR